MQAWFPTGELIHGRGSCPPTSLPTGFSEWGLSHISHAWNGFPQKLTVFFATNWVGCSPMHNRRIFRRASEKHSRQVRTQKCSLEWPTGPTFGGGVEQKPEWRSLQSTWKVRKWRKLMSTPFFQNIFSEKKNQLIALRIKSAFFFFKVRDTGACLYANVLIKISKIDLK